MDNLDNIKIPIFGFTTPVEDPEGILGVSDVNGNPIESPAVATTKIEVIDAVSEGPIGGLIEGTYNYEGVEGNVGWEKALYSQYPEPPNMTNARWLRSIYWNEVPVVNSNNEYNFQQVDVSHFVGTADGAYDSGTGKVLGMDVPELRISRQVNERLYGSLKDRMTSESVDSESDYTKVYRIHNVLARGCIVNIKVNQLFRSINTVDDEFPIGSVVKTRVDYKIYYKPIFSDQTKNPKSYKFGSQDYIEGKVTDGAIKSTRVNFYNDDMEDPDFRGWEIAIVRLTPESVTVNIRNATVIDSITEIYTDGYLYPYTALVRGKFSAEFFSNVPQRSFHVRGLKVKVPNNYNTVLRTYGQERGGLIGGTGYSGAIGGGKTAAEGGDSTVNGKTDIWNGYFKSTKEYTNNPAWVFYDLLTNPIYGLGQHIDEDEVDKFTLYEIAQYCDELVLGENGELEPRFTCNLVMTTREDAIKVLQDLASIFRGLVYYKSGSIFATYDRPLIGNRVFTFNNANVENGEFIYQSSGKSTRHSVAYVRFNDKKNFYKPAIEIVEDAGAIKRNGIRIKEISAFGCTTRGQARRLGLWSILTDTYNTESVSFVAGLQGAYLQPNDVIAIADKYKKMERTTGRTIEIYGGEFTEDSYGVYHLTNGGGATASNNTSGKIGGCAIVAGANLYTTDAGIHIPYTSSFSVSAWIKHNGGGSVQSIASKSEAGGEGWDLFYNGSTQKLNFYVEDSVGNSATVTATSAGNISSGTWYYVVATIDRENARITIQVNGGAVDEASLSNVNVISPSTAMKIGNNGANDSYAGSIDQVCIWSGWAVDANQANQMYNGGNGMTINEMGYNCKKMVSCYELQDGPTVVLDDEISYIEDGEDYLLSLVTPTYNYYHDVSDLDSDDLPNIQRPQTQNIEFAGTEHEIRNNKSYLFLENQFDRSTYNVSGSLIYSIEKLNYSDTDINYLTTQSGDYYRVLNVSATDNGTKYQISAIEYDHDKFAMIDDKTTFERLTTTINIDPEPPILGIIEVGNFNQIISAPPPNSLPVTKPPQDNEEEDEDNKPPVLERPVEYTGDFLDPDEEMIPNPDNVGYSQR